MRLNNRNKAARYNFISTLLLIILLGGLALFYMDSAMYHILGSKDFLLIILPVLLLVIFYLRGRQIFEYDSDGEALNFKNRSVVPLMGKDASDEFPKYKLSKYEIVDTILFKRLYVTIMSKKSHPIILKYDISYLNHKEVNDLKLSLNKVVKSNRENGGH